uniref:Uncharacterized protein n=1 Tax=Ascaris lumbricoides TaxID=6252 RepID=A0A0M3IVN0_ASCLU
MACREGGKGKKSNGLQRAPPPASNECTQTVSSCGSAAL